MGMYLKIKLKSKTDNQTLKSIDQEFQIEKKKKQCSKSFLIKGYTNQTVYRVNIFIIQTYEIEIRVLNSEIPLARYKFEVVEPIYSFKEDLLGIYGKTILKIEYSDIETVNC